MTRKIDLPSGAWVEIREDLRAKDRFAVQDVATLEVGEGRNKAVSVRDAERHAERAPRPDHHRLVVPRPGAVAELVSRRRTW